MGDRPWVQGPHPLDRSQVAGALSESSVLLSGSSTEGGPPNSVIEAISSELVVLITDIPAHREALGLEGDDTSPFLATSPEMFQSTLEKWLAQPDEWRRVREEIHRQGRQLPAVEDEGRAFLKLYEKTIDR